jgi:hypothetical protein
MDGAALPCLNGLVHDMFFYPEVLLERKEKMMWVDAACHQGSGACHGRLI